MVALQQFIKHHDCNVLTEIPSHTILSVQGYIGIGLEANHNAVPILAQVRAVSSS